MSWDEIIGRLTIHGIPPERVARMTKRQVFGALYQLLDEREWELSLTGAKIEDEAEDDAEPLQEGQYYITF